MGLSDLLDRAKGIVQKRGGTDALKEDAQELKDVAKSDASTTDKGKEGVEAVKDPGAKGPEEQQQQRQQQQQQQQQPPPPA
jgi:hypothetical protein